jgi:NAD(P) transhydrogenase subunit alpha
MKIAIPTERREGERRVAVSPDTVKKFVALNCDVVMERGAGEASSVPDDQFAAMGATFADDFTATVAGADLILKVQRPTAEERAILKPGQILVCTMNPLVERDDVAALAEAGVMGFAMELMPRISRAQSMDVLSSQANLAGYKAVLDAAEYYDRAMPMMMTAAGTVAPARIFVMGAGVAGLQAIATARRLGGVVSATDVRPAVKEQVESLGASFVMVEDEETAEAETAGGYAKEMSEDYKRKQQALVAEHIKKQDIVITTALIPGRPAPTLVTEEMVASMKSGSVIVDLAVEAGGNCPLSKPGEVVKAGGVTIIGHRNWPSRLATDASALYAKNLLNFLSPHIDGDSGALNFNFEDETVAGVLVCRDGKVVHPMLTGEGN